MNTLPGTPDDFEALAAERKPIETDNGRHLMVKVGDELTGVITNAQVINGKYGDLRVIVVSPHRAISDGVDTTAAGGTELRCTGAVLERWFDKEQPEAGNLVSIVLEQLLDTGKDSPMKLYSAALQRDPGPAVDANDPGVDVDSIAATWDVEGLF
jgi:hypothetical protein